MNLGQIIQQYRLEKGFSRELLAKLCDVDPQDVFAWENNSKPIMLPTLLRLIHYLQIDEKLLPDLPISSSVSKRDTDTFMEDLSQLDEEEKMNDHFRKINDASQAQMTLYFERNQDGVFYHKYGYSPTLSNEQLAELKAVPFIQNEKWSDVLDNSSVLIAFSGDNKVIKQRVEASLNQYRDNYKMLEEQHDIVKALSRNYKNVFLINMANNCAKVVKLEGYVTEGLDPNDNNCFPYDVFVERYINNRVVSEDRDYLRRALNATHISEKLRNDDEYSASYRVWEDGVVHHYQFTYLRLDDDPEKHDRIVAGFKNIDDLVDAQKQHEEDLQKSHLREMRALDAANKDTLTGLMNRRAYENTLKNADKTLNAGVLFCDINGLKYINDTQGHKEGDKRIIHFAKLLTENFSADSIYRISGDEFVVIIFKISEENFARRAQRLHLLIQDNGELASMGEYYGSTYDLSALVKAAEVKMYFDKTEHYARHPEQAR